MSSVRENNVAGVLSDSHRSVEGRFLGADALWVTPALDSYVDANNRCWPSVAVCAEQLYTGQLLLTNRNAGHQSWWRQDGSQRRGSRRLYASSVAPHVGTSAHKDPSRPILDDSRQTASISWWRFRDHSISTLHTLNLRLMPSAPLYLMTK